jgi:hypothetical protein
MLSGDRGPDGCWARAKAAGGDKESNDGGLHDVCFGFVCGIIGDCVSFAAVAKCIQPFETKEDERHLRT